MSRRLTLGVAAVLGLLLCGAFLAPHADAVQIKTVYKGLVQFDDNDLVKTATLPAAVDLTKTILLTTVQGSQETGNADDDQNYFYTAQFEDNQTVSFDRGGGTRPAQVTYTVIEFVDGVTVQRGISSMTETLLLKYISIPQTIDRTKAVPILNCRGLITTQGDTEVLSLLGAFYDQGVNATDPSDDVASNNYLRIRRLRSASQAGITRTINITWQVIEFLTDVTVKSGTVQVGETQLSNTATVSPAIADTSKAFLSFMFAGGSDPADGTPGIDGVDEMLLVRGTVTNSTTLTFTRAEQSSAGTFDTVDVQWYVVEFTDTSSTVQKGTTNPATPDFHLGAAGATITASAYSNPGWWNSNLVANITLANSVDTTRAFPVVSASSGLDNTTNTNDAIEEGLVRAELTTGTNLQLTRLLRGDTETTAVFAATADWFVVEGTPLTLTSPDGNEVWKVGENRNITWKHAKALESGGTGPGSAHAMKIEIRTGASGSDTCGTTYPLSIATGLSAAADTYAWTIPAAISSTDLDVTTLRIKITDTDLTARNCDISDANFEVKGTLTVTAPNTAVTWFVGDTNRNITWSQQGNLDDNGTVTLKLYHTSGTVLESTIVTSLTPSAGTYAWNPIPDKIRSDLQGGVELSSDPTGVNDKSDVDFSIKGTVTITYPNGAETLETQKAYNITWNKTGTFPAAGGACTQTDRVDLLYSTNSGGSYPNSIATCQPAGVSSGSYNWTVPTSAVSTVARVRVHQTGDIAVVDDSNADFTIVPSITVTSPTSGTEVWLVGESRNITWTINGTGINNVKLDYSTGSCGGVFNPIVASTGATAGTYPWTVPDAVGGTTCVKVSNADNLAIFDTSDNVFRIKATVHVLSPNNGEVWTVGSSQNITWENLGTVGGTVTLLYSTTGGSSYPNTIASGVAIGALSQPWTIPDAIGNTVRVKVAPSDATNVAEDESDANFLIKGSLTLTAPNTAVNWLVGSSQNITWTKTGAIGNVELQYSTNGGSSYGSPFATGLDPVSGTPYPWAVPDDISNAARVRVRLVADTTVNDESDVNFAIKGAVTVTAPNNGEVWKVGETTRDITWGRTGTTGAMAGNVELRYSTDGGSTYPNVIHAGTSNTGIYNWNPIPDAIDTDIRVKVTLVNDTSVFDTSDANFTIKGQLTVTQPNTNLIWFVGDTTRNITWNTNGTIANVKLYYATDGTTFSNPIAGGAPLSNVGSYNWNPIPDIIGTNVRVRVENDADSTVYDDSDTSFTVKGTLTLTAPNGGQIWMVGDTQNITWTRTGTLSGNVKLLYSTDGGATYPDPGNMITNSVAVTAGSYAWTVPDTIDTDLRVRIIYLNDTSVTDESDANFTVQGSLNITAPDGGEVWELGTVQNIVWNLTGTVGAVRLEYSTDGGATFPNLIVTSTPSETDPPSGANNGQYAWTIPTNAPLSTTARVRVTPVTAGNAAANSSENNFRLKGKVTLTAPNGTETWVVGDPQNITWTTVGAIANVKLEYSTDGGATWPAGNVIVASTPAGAGSYPWTVADGISTQVRVRISDASDSSVVDTSDADFTIKGSLTLTAPNGGQAWVVGTSQNVTWTRTGTLPNVRLEYSTDGGLLYPNLIVASTPGGALSYAWTIPDAIGTLLRVRVTYDTSPDALDLSDASDANFTIKGSLTLTAPNGNEGWPINSTQNITWTKTGTLTGLLRLEYSTDAGVTYPVGNLISATVPAADTSYAWTIPDNPTTQGRVRITQLADTSVNDASDANFSIKGSLFIQFPNGGEVWKVGESRNVTWTRGGSIANARLDYSVDGGATFPNVIVASTPAGNLSYPWTIPDAIDNDIRVKITDVGDNTVTDISDGNFSIKGIVTLTAPNGGQTWVVNNVQNITWTKSGTIPNVTLDYSIDGGVTYPNVIAASVPGADLTYAWTIPDAIGTQLRVRITNVDDAIVTDSSDANFTIKGSLTLTSPNGSETWIVNENRSLTWTRQGSIANVKLEYSTNGFSDELQTVTIAASTPAAPLSYAWIVADAIGAQVRVRVSDAADSAVSDVSNANFTIKGALVLTAPNGSEVWTVNSSRNVTWTRTGSITNVKLEYSTNSGSTYPNLITASTDAATGSYSWTVPDAITATAKVRVSDVNDATVLDESNAVFKIVGVLTLTAPNGTEQWTVGTSQNITWTRVGSVANAMLEYSTNSGSTYPNVIVATTAASALSYSWTIPNTPTATARVKISDVDYSNDVSDTSNADFKIKAGLTLIAPNSGEVWTVGSAQNITWTTVGTAANVKLEYSTDGGSTYPNVITASVSNTGSYSWTVADAISTTVRVKVSDAGDADAFDTSDANFKIRGALLLTAPNGSEAWPISSGQNITWTRTGSLPNVKLEYSTNGFADELQTVVIIASTPADPAPLDNNGTYAWTIPDAPGTTNKVRVSDASDATVNDISNANFKIQGVLTLTAPNSGEVWTVGANQNITWTKLGNIANVELRYSNDGGTTYPAGKIIVASTAASSLSYSWTIPDDISTTLRVKITDTGDSAVFDDSDANFKIRGSILLGAPNGGETWIVGASQNITWTRSGSFANVKLEYSINGGTTYPNVITASAPAAPLSFAWTIPDAIGTQLRVQVSDANDSTVVDTSNADFEIKGSLTLTSPNGTEVWKVGENRDITWTKTGTMATVTLEYSTNGGTSYPNVITASTNATTGTPYAWTIPDAIGTQLRVKVTNNADAAVNDASNANFEVKGQVTLTAPNGSEVWVVGSSQNITWTKQGTFATVKLEYSTDGGTTYPTVITASADAVTGTPYAWTVPDAIGNQLRVRVTNNADSAVNDVSDANFKIVGSLTLTAPNGSEIWTVGTVQNITWTRVGSIANAKLEYSTDGGVTYPNLIVASTGAGTGAYSWTIPDAIGTQARVKITDASDATVSDTSNANFKILGGFVISVPNGGEVWAVGDSQNVTWTTAGTVANVKLEYSTDGGSTYPNTIIASTGNTGTYGWTVPDAISTTVRVRVSDAADAAALDTSNGNFKIRGSLLLTAPNGGNAWPIGSTQNVTWTKTGSIANVKLEYSTDGGTTYPNLIVASTAAAPLSYAWTIPNAQSTTVRVRVTDVADSTVLDSSDANFKIKGVLTLTSPNGSEVWIVGTGYNITWTKTGAFIANVELRYSTDGGATYPAGKVIVASTAADNLSYNWTVPDDISNTVRVRITDLTDTSIIDDSDANVSIKGSLILTAPNGSEVWIVSDVQNITWAKTGTIANVELEYSIDGGSTYPNLIVASVASTPASYAWTLPDAIGNAVRVKVSNVSDASVFDTSNGNFSIKGSVTLNVPNGGETWIVGASQPITWSKVGSIANVKLEYSTDGGVSYPSLIVASVAAGTGSYSWMIPDAITTTARVKVTNVDDSAVFDVSNGNFKIAGSLTVTAPNGAEAWLIGTSQNITWTKTGSIANIKLEYSTDGGATYPNLVVASVDATTGTPYAWVIPDAPTTTAKVKVTNTADASVFDESNGNFNIRGSVTLTSPNGVEVWVVGESRNITWTRTGSFPNVELRYSTNSGSTYPNVITAATAAGALSYAWTVPDAISTTLRVRITDAGDSAVTDTSDADFKIRGSVTLTVPNGAEVWIVGASQNITWTRTGSFANVRLDYSTDGGSTYPNVISASAPAAPLSFAWAVPDAIGTQLRVRVSDAADATVVDTSDANFTIKGSLTLNAPNGGETWIVGASQNITWAKTGTIANVSLQYSTDGGTSYPNVITSSVAGSALTYAWTIPDTISSTVRVKITDLADLTVTDTSNGNFKIAGSLMLTTPDGGQVWIVGATQNITWTKSGSIANARLDYSTDGGVSYPNVITTSVSAAALTFAWTVPDNMSSTVKVRITDLSDATVFDASTTNFKIAGSFILTAPDGGEKWPAGSTQSITWTRTGSIVNARLEYSTDGGVMFPNLIVATTPANNLSYAWTLGSATSTQVRVRITDVADLTVYDVSNVNFKIMGGFTLTAPNSGEVWIVGETRSITWNTVGSVANVKLSYSVDGGTTYPNTITASTTNTGSYAWTIPDAIGTTLRVKVEDVLDPDATDTSDANFKIKGSVTVMAPNGAEIWTVQSAQNITWTRTGSVPNVKIEYSTDGGTTYPVGNLIAASVNAALGTYAWTIPDAISTTVRVRITDVTDATVFDESNASFTIRGSFTLTAPNGGQKWTVGTTQPITWTTFGTIPNIRLEYSMDGGSTYPTVITASTANTGTYNWSVPNAISATVRVRVSNAADPGTLDTSDANFKIMAGFTVTAPDGGEVLVVGASQSMTWTTTGTVSNVRLEYSTDSGASYPNVIATSTPNSGTFAWTVPDTISATMRVRVSDATDSADAFDASNGNFKIRAGFTLNAPNGSEEWIVGTTQNITWTTAGTVANVKLEYSTDGGTSFPNVLAASTANTGTYAWVIPDAITTAARVRVSDVNDITANDTSNTNFKIRGNLTITAPNGVEAWTVGSVRTITWDRVGSIGFVKLEFSTNGGGLYAPITASTSNTGSYAWTIPDNISTNCLVKVTDTNDATVTDASNAAFKIQAGFTLTAPNGGENWLVGSAQTITWTTNGTVPFVKLDYSTDAGATFPNLISSSTANSSTFAWVVPDAVSGSVRVRVSDTTDATAFDTSNGNFRIRLAFTLTAPNGAEQWRVGQVRNITWTNVGTIPNVKLEYSRDGFLADIQSIAASATNTGSFAWTLPDAISNTVRVRVSDPNDIGAFDTSNADFRITGDFTVTAPNGSEQWIVGTVQNITWTKTGSVTNAKIEYSTNSGGTWLSVAGLTPNDGDFAWTIPDTITAQGRVRLSDPTDATADDISNADFKIKAGFTLAAPNGTEIWTVGEARTLTWTNSGTVPNVKLTFSTDGGTSYANTISASSPNTGTYAWTVPDAISAQVRVKVESPTDVDAFDASDADLKIRGALSLTAPNGGEGWQIAQNHTITWATTGTIPNVRLSYSIDGGTTYPNVIAASVANTNAYVWNVPDAPSTTARVRVEDVNDTTVLDDSNANFSIQGNFTITAPNGSEVWSVGESRNITWSWGGTIPTVKLLYSTNGGTTYPNTITASAPNGVGSSGTFSYAWTIPDSISTTVRVRIENTADASTFDASDANFKIQAKFILAAPNGSERWVTNETRSIVWTTAGTVPNVRLEYSTDGGVTYPVGNVIAASTLNTGSYTWTVPDVATPPLATVRVRVLDAADLTVFDQSDANFTLDYYRIPFRVKDLLSNANLDQISISAGTPNLPGGTPAPIYSWTESGLASPFTKGLPAGAWSVKVSRVSYGDQVINFTVGTATETSGIDVFMETQVVHIWEAVTEVAYVPAQAALPTNVPPVPAVTESLTVTSTLRRDGAVVTGAVYGKVDIYDGGTLVRTFTCNAAPDGLGFYRPGLAQCGGTWEAWTSPGLQGGKVYNVISELRIATGGIFKTPRTFTVNVESKLQETKNTVDTKLDVKLSDALGITPADIAAGTTVKKLLNDQTTAINTSLTNFNNTVASSLTSLETAATTSSAAATTLQNVAFQQSARVLAPPTATTGLPLIIRWRGPVTQAGLPVPNLAPKISVDNADGQAIVSLASMTPVAGATNLFEWKDQAVAADTYLPGKNILITVKEDAIGSLLTSTVFVQRPAGKILLKESVKIGDKVKIHLAGASNWTPLIELSSDGTALVKASAMKKISDDGKVTTFEFEVPKSLESIVKVGQVLTAVVTEPLTGYFDQSTFQYTGTSLDDLSGQIAAASTSKTVIQDTFDAVRDLQGSLGGDGSISQKLEAVKQKVDKLPRAIAEEGGTVQMRQAIVDVAERINTLAGEEGYDFSQLMELGVEKGLEKSETVKDIRKKTDAVQGATEVMQILMENKLGGIDDPVVHVIYE